MTARRTAIGAAAQGGGRRQHGLCIVRRGCRSSTRIAAVPAARARARGAVHPHEAPAGVAAGTAATPSGYIAARLVTGPGAVRVVAAVGRARSLSAASPDRALVAYRVRGVAAAYRHRYGRYKSRGRARRRRYGIKEFCVSWRQAVSGVT